MLSKNTDWILALWKLTVLWIKEKLWTLAISNVSMKKKPQHLKKSDVSENRSNQRNGNLLLKRQKYSANFPPKENNVRIHINMLNKICDIFSVVRKLDTLAEETCGYLPVMIDSPAEYFCEDLTCWFYCTDPSLQQMFLKYFFFNFHLNRYRRKRQKVDASIFDSALSHTRRSDASEKNRRK